MRMNNPAPVRRRKATNLSLDPKLVEEARELGVNLSQACEAGLISANKMERERRWLEENRAAMEDWNRWIERNGLPLDHIRAY